MCCSVASSTSSFKHLCEHLLVGAPCRLSISCSPCRSHLTYQQRVVQLRQAQQQAAAQLQEATQELEALRIGMNEASSQAEEAQSKERAASQTTAAAQLRLQDVEAEKRLAQEQVNSP